VPLLYTVDPSKCLSMLYKGLQFIISPIWQWNNKYILLVSMVEACSCICRLINYVSGYLLSWQNVPPAALHSCIKSKFCTSKILAKHVDMVGRQGMRAEFRIGKFFVNSLLDYHGSVGRALRWISQKVNLGEDEGQWQSQQDNTYIVVTQMMLII
jgi:hypothetical protein